MKTPHESTWNVETRNLATAAASLQMRRFPNLAETFDYIIPEKPAPSEAKCHNQCHPKVRKSQRAPLTVGVMLGAFDCEGF